MALDYAATAALMDDGAFKARVKVAALHFAGYITGEDPGTNAHRTRYQWAQNTLAQPDFVATNITPVVVGDPNVQTLGADIPDDMLQSAVETAINKML
jgi:hypothetical protein